MATDAATPRLGVWAGGDAPDEAPQDVYAEMLGRELLRPLSRKAAVPEPLSREWFALADGKRYARHGAWMLRLLEMHKHPGERLLALGDGLGCDWARYARHGTSVTVCGESAAGLAVARRHFEVAGLGGQFVHASPARLPFDDDLADLAYVNAGALRRPDPLDVIDEVERVLKPGGKVIALLPAFHDSAAWVRWAFPWRRWFAATSPVDATSEDRRYTKRQARLLFGRFQNVRVYQRHLRRGELPHLWRPLPLPLMERCMGRLLVVKGVKAIAGEPAGAKRAA